MVKTVSSLAVEEQSLLLVQKSQAETYEIYVERRFSALIAFGKATAVYEP